MNETKKVMDSKDAFMDLVKAGDVYFSNPATWTREGVDKFLEQFQFSASTVQRVSSYYRSVVFELSKSAEVTKVLQEAAESLQRIVHEYSETTELRNICSKFN